MVPHSAGDWTPGGGRHVLADRLEHLADEALRRPVGQTDLAARFADARQLARRLFLIRCEHHAEGGHHDVEGRVGERQVLGVGFLEPDRVAFGRARARPA